MKIMMKRIPARNSDLQEIATELDTLITDLPAPQVYPAFKFDDGVLFERNIVENGSIGVRDTPANADGGVWGKVQFERVTKDAGGRQGKASPCLYCQSQNRNCQVLFNKY